MTQSIFHHLRFRGVIQYQLPATRLHWPHFLRMIPICCYMAILQDCINVHQWWDLMARLTMLRLFSLIFQMLKLFILTAIACFGAQRPAELFLLVGHLSPGLYSLLMKFNQVSYQGSVLVTDSNYVFTWNYTSGIIISPLTVKK